MTAFWIWMIVDCATREPDVGNDKLIWILVVVLAGQPAALTPLNASTLSYTPPPTLANPTPPTATVAPLATSAVVDAAFADCLDKPVHTVAAGQLDAVHDLDAVWQPAEADPERVRATLEVVERAGVKLQVGFNRRFDPTFSRVRQSVIDGDIGDVHQIINRKIHVTEPARQLKLANRPSHRS